MSEPRWAEPHCVKCTNLVSAKRWCNLLAACCWPSVCEQRLEIVNARLLEVAAGKPDDFFCVHSEKASQLKLTVLVSFSPPPGPYIRLLQDSYRRSPSMGNHSKRRPWTYRERNTLIFANVCLGSFFNMMSLKEHAS